MADRWGAHSPVTRRRVVAFGEAVRARRKQLGLSQEKLAERAGCDRQSVNRTENAAYAPSLPRVFLLAAALDWTPPQLMDAAEERYQAAVRTGGESR